MKLFVFLTALGAAAALSAADATLLQGQNPNPWSWRGTVAVGRTLEIRGVMGFIRAEAREASAALAQTRGPFPNHARSIHAQDGPVLRNATTTTIAPTGTLSILAGTTSGIEPLFAVAFLRNQAGVLMPDVNEDFVAAATRGSR